MLTIFTTIEGTLADLYPYRYVITPLIVLVGLLAVGLALRAGLHRVLLQHRLATGVIGVPLLVAAGVVGNYLVSPLWERSHLDEASPLVSISKPGDVSADGRTPQIPVALGGAMTTRKGMFMGADSFHFGRGEALIIRNEAGAHVLRFENFSVRNGPDLYVYLSRDVDGKRVEEPLNLGRLKATDGAFNYEIPASVDLAGVRSVVVWCKQFTTLFAVAPLSSV